ncbi:hypothetical protein CEXT_696801 [Caerostris extrusa]|uniref:Uncharacterized protein n=1 Tax=Caerostris extrusa TaxID=172846 RepID=A0AAV4SY89_CAEEX|nr:hypothetical protein CEXT_696801 [Caerostris extrusa]
MYSTLSLSVLDSFSGIASTFSANAFDVFCQSFLRPDSAGKNMDYAGLSGSPHNALRVQFSPMESDTRYFISFSRGARTFVITGISAFLSQSLESAHFSQ